MAVVVSNDEPQYLQSALAALANQSFRVERTLVVDSSSNPEIDEVLSIFVSSSSHNAVLQIKESASFAELAATGIKQALQGYDSIDEIAIWLLHDDSAPEVHALAELVRALELSPLVAIASPKQVSFENPKLIEQMGLTVTKSLKPF
ncbi:MAG: glycosyltransferase, partial [Microbacteriaceae bacterium]|nr:glycosyltransferase [Microbacteriaceae bacterium]